MDIEPDARGFDHGNGELAPEVLTELLEAVEHVLRALGATHLADGLEELEAKAEEQRKDAVGPLDREQAGAARVDQVECHADGDSLAGTLTALGAQLLLVRDGHPEITPEEGVGSFTLWFRDGIVYRYKVRLHGLLAIQTPNGTRRVKVKQTMTTLLQDVGSTNVVIPAEVLQRFGQ